MTILGVGVVSADAWADTAHLPCLRAYDRARLVVDSHLPRPWIEAAAHAVIAR
jgi:hypothetical protein